MVSKLPYMVCFMVSKLPYMVCFMVSKFGQPGKLLKTFHEECSSIIPVRLVTSEGKLRKQKPLISRESPKF